MLGEAAQARLQGGRQNLVVGVEKHQVLGRDRTDVPCKVLNVEAAFGTADGRLWLGLRAPLAGKRAVCAAKSRSPVRSFSAPHSGMPFPEGSFPPALPFVRPAVG
jgi:hypothetical protein